MQIEIVRHHGRTEDAKREIEHVRIGDNLCCRCETADHRAPFRIGHRDLDAETDGDHGKHCDDKRFDPAETEILHPQDQKHVERCNDDADFERNAEQEI